jgi:PPM family protein phosphatase
VQFPGFENVHWMAGVVFPWEDHYGDGKSQFAVYVGEPERILGLGKLTYEAAAKTDRGRKRASNEDAFGFSLEHGIFLVCDGMGGAAAGEVASNLAVKEFLTWFTEHLSPDLSEADTDALLRDAVSHTNLEIHKSSLQAPQLHGMGTTLVGIFVRGDQVWIVNIGDSRCYRLRDGGMEQCTHDHSLVEEQVRLGRMTADEAARSPMRNVITRAVGTRTEVAADVLEVEARAGDVFLLCSDGLTKELRDPQIERLLQEEDTPSGACERLVESANWAGGRDNITCLVLRVEEVQEST